MTDANTFVENFLKHDYDPVKAHAYYLRTRELKGRASAAEKAGAKSYQQHQVGDAQKKLNADLKKAGPVKLSKVRRIGAAEQKLIRARSLAMRVKDPQVRADMIARVSAAEKKLRKIKGTIDLIHPKKAVNKAKVNPRSKVQYNGKPLKKLGTRMEEDETPEVSPTGAKLKDYNGTGLGKGTYADGYVYDAAVGWKKPRRAG